MVSGPRPPPPWKTRYRYGVSPKYFAGGGVHPITATTSSSRRRHSQDISGPVGRTRPSSAASGTLARPKAGMSIVDIASSSAARWRRVSRKLENGRSVAADEGRGVALIVEAPAFVDAEAPAPALDASADEDVVPLNDDDDDDDASRPTAVMFAGAPTEDGDGDEEEEEEEEEEKRDNTAAAAAAPGIRRGDDATVAAADLVVVVRADDDDEAASSAAASPSETSAAAPASVVPPPARCCCWRCSIASLSRSSDLGSSVTGCSTQDRGRREKEREGRERERFARRVVSSPTACFAWMGKSVCEHDDCHKHPQKTKKNIKI